MDHLSHLRLGGPPSDPHAWPPIMPEYTLPGYEPGDEALVADFDGRMSDAQLHAKLLSDDMADRCLGHVFLQTWSFFGLIRRVLGTPLAPAYAPRPYGTGPLDAHLAAAQPGALRRVDTTALRALTHRWIRDTGARVRRDNGAARLRAHREVLGVLSCVADHWTTLYIHTKHKKGIIDSGLELSVALLCEYLEWASRVAHGPWDLESHPCPTGPVFISNHDEMISNYMQRVGWCPAELNLMADSFSYIDMWRLSFLQVPHAGKDHSRCSESGKCSAYQIDEKSYRTKHDDAGCTGGDCEFVYASVDRLADILLGPSQGIPLVQNADPKRDKKDKRLYANLISSRPTGRSSPVRWVAISHVWSDGLGNNRKNGIPLCQFNRLRRLSAALPAPGSATRLPFWQDTLCFPLRPQEAYNQALVRMKESYEGAHAVLVLDAYLLGVEARGGGVTMEELMARIVVCPWNRRLWTWQEAFLARRDSLYFQFRDEAVSDTTLLAVCDGGGRTGPDQILDLILAQRIYARFRDVRTKNADRPLMERVALAKDTLTFRSTSQAPDEALCLTNVLGGDVRAILEAKDKDRMHALWSQVVGPGQYHASVLFWAGPKLDVKGFRWAPATFMDATRTSAQQNWPRLDGCVTGLSNDGLHVRLSSIDCPRLVVSDKGICSLRVHRQGWLEFPFLFILDLHGWWHRLKRLKESEDFVVLLPYMFDNHRTWESDVHVAAKLKNSGDKLRLLGPGSLARVGDEDEEPARSMRDWVDAWAVPESNWKID